MRRFALYTVVGGIATAAHYALLIACVELAGWPAWLASGFGAVVGAQIAFLGNRRYTFEHRGDPSGPWLRFQGTALVGALMGMVIVAGGVRIGLHYLLAQAIATGAMLVLTFAINRAWSFR